MKRIFTGRYTQFLFGIIAVAGFSASWLIFDQHTIAATLDRSTEQICQVASIYDGDTMRVICNGERMKLRLNCIDTPEMQQKPWGRESRDYLRAIATKSVRVIGSKKDRYGRLIAEVWTHDDDEIQENLNLALVFAGQAAVYPKYCKDQQYYDAQKAAEQNRAGIWEKPGLHQSPWEYRKAKRKK